MSRNHKRSARTFAVEQRALTPKKPRRFASPATTLALRARYDLAVKEKDLAAIFCYLEHHSVSHRWHAASTLVAKAYAQRQYTTELGPVGDAACGPNFSLHLRRRANEALHRLVTHGSGGIYQPMQDALGDCAMTMRHFPGMSAGLDRDATPLARLRAWLSARADQLVLKPVAHAADPAHAAAQTRARLPLLVLNTTTV